MINAFGDIKFLEITAGLHIKGGLDVAVDLNVAAGLEFTGVLEFTVGAENAPGEAIRKVLNLKNIGLSGPDRLPQALRHREHSS